MSHDAHSESILIIDFGSQVTQLIARRIRETGVYCEIWPYQKASEGFQKLKPKGVIFSGGPDSVTREGSPRAPQEVFERRHSDHGDLLWPADHGGAAFGVVEGGHAAEFGRADVKILKNSPLFDGLWEVGGEYPVWMSHGDRVTQAPEGFEIIGVSENAPFAICVNEAKRYYTTMFHPEVVLHTPDGGKLLANFVHNIVGLHADWTMSAYRAEMVQKIRDQVGSGRVLCALSGGVDSSVAAVLIHEAIGDQLTCVYVDHGLMRLGESEQVVGMFRDHFNIPLIHVDASDLFIGQLEGEADPETKRKTIGRLFIEVFEEQAKRSPAMERVRRSFWPRARSIRTSSRASPSRAARPSRSRATTMSAACRTHEHEAGRAAA